MSAHLLLTVSVLSGLNVAISGLAWADSRYVITDVGLLSGGRVSYGNALNAAGQVVGSADAPPFDAIHAFFYDGVVMRDLGPAPVNTMEHVEAFGINLA